MKRLVFVLGSFLLVFATRAQNDWDTTTVNQITYSGAKVGIGTTSPSSALTLDKGTGSLSTGLTFGDGNTGFYENADNTLVTSIGGVNTFYWAGNLFRGANTSSPALMHEVASSSNPTLIPSNSDQDTGIGWSSTNQLSLITGGSESIRINAVGNIGIGTSSPSRKLQINESSTSTYITVTSSNSTIAGILFGDQVSDAMGRLTYDNSTDALKFFANNLERMSISSNGAVSINGNKIRFSESRGFDYDTSKDAVFYNGYNNGQVAMLSDRDGNAHFNGNVGIGTTTPSEKLEVNGTIRSKEVKVEASPWPDYVFDPNYELPTLESIEKFIQSYNHLPEIPSAKEIETNGLEVGKMNALLLKKIEELTLYAIEQEDELQVVSSKLQEMEVENEELRISNERIVKESEVGMEKLRIENEELRIENEAQQKRLEANSLMLEALLKRIEKLEK